TLSERRLTGKCSAGTLRTNGFWQKLHASSPAHSTIVEIRHYSRCPYEYIAGVLPDHMGPRADGRVIVAHLDNGASMCAMKERQSVATSMGFTALDGLMMGRRSGSLDAGVVLHLLQNQGMTIDEVQHMLYRESGLLGVSGISNNMQVLLESTDPNAREAVELFCYRAACELGALITSLGGLDAIIFTASIGENAAEVRGAICAHLSWLGADLDPAANNGHATVVSAAHSTVAVLVLPTNEEAVIADATRALTN
ncbi:MAG: acetate kinase, partial [Rhodospirillaceae bacterium]|nr:acetate kinase [Rhodospirillaceae bacterium]